MYSCSAGLANHCASTNHAWQMQLLSGSPTPVQLYTTLLQPFFSLLRQSLPLVQTRLSPNIRSSSFSLLNAGAVCTPVLSNSPVVLKLPKKSWLPMQNNDSIHIWKSESFYWNYELIQIFWKATCIKTLMMSFLWTIKTSLKDLS